jgi:uncharacterized RDD family membrane protein YckC
MSYDQSRYAASDARPQVYDPAANPELFQGVLAARIIAFLIDAVIVGLVVVAVSIFIFLFGLVTLGLGWLLFWPLGGAAVVWAVLYYGFTLGGPRSATIGMRMMGIEMRTTYGAPAYFVLGAAWVILYWVSVSFLTPFILLVGLFNARSRLLHDFLLGAVLINSPERAARFAYRR